MSRDCRACTSLHWGSSDGVDYVMCYKTLLPPILWINRKYGLDMRSIEYDVAFDAAEVCSEFKLRGEINEQK